MNSVDSLYLFIFVFCILISLRFLLKTTGSLLQENPKPIVFSDKELVFSALSLSYIITYIFQS